MLDRRALLAATALLPWLAGPALAADNLKIIAPAAPGGGWDQTARSMQQAIQAASLAKTVQVSNIPGAGGTIGLAQFVNNAKGDPNALMVCGLVMVGSILANKSPVDLSMVTPIARLTGEYQVVAVPAKSPIKDLAGLVAAMKADPGKVAWAGGSAGGVDHIMVGLFAKAIGLDPTRINYVAFSGGGEAQAALLGAHVAAGVSGYGEFAQQAAAGRIRLLGIASEARPEGAKVPTLKEQGVDIVLSNWRGVVAAPGISAAQAADLIEQVSKMAKSPAWKSILDKNGWSDQFLAGEAYGRFLAEENRRVATVLESVGLLKR
ncbi:MAG: tripartite tricarboxylate transporter substrate binding protein [Alphaproteobacteria bacterium]|nr:tripartite tricarboxylate transporter substrate binding protein [Alphaproteobacteria bacterium]